MIKKLHRRVQGSFLYEGFGFPLLLLHVPMVRVRGAWTPEVDYNELGKRVLVELARKPSRLTGNETRFIRHKFSMTLDAFARRFGVTHPAVLKWERAGNRATVMNWAVEKDIRLEALRAVAPRAAADFVEAYERLRAVPSSKPLRVRLQAEPA